jgi:hypothetical protein
VIAVLGDLGEAPLDKLKLLIRLFTDLEIGTRDHAMRAFGASDPRIGRAVDAADELVLATLEKILRSLGLSPEDTRAFARIMMFSAIGFYSAPKLLGESGTRELGKRILSLMMERSNAK